MIVHVPPRPQSVSRIRWRPALRTGLTLVELMVSSLLITIFAYGAGNAYVSYLAAKQRGDSKLRLQEDATQATEHLVRAFRSADSVRVTGTFSAGTLTISTYDEGDPTATDAVYLKAATGGHMHLVHNTGSGERLIVPAFVDSLAVTKSASLVQLTVRLADSSGNTITTLGSARLRN